METIIPRATTAEEVGVNSKECLEFIKDAKKNNLEFHSMMIIRHGKVACEWYNEPMSADKPHMMYSVSKSVVSTAVGFAIEEGYFNLDDKVMDFFPDYPPKKPSPNFDKMTVYTLLTMSSGKNVNVINDKGKIDWIDDFVNSPWKFEHGTDFLYVSENVFMLCSIIRRTTGMSVTDFLNDRLWKPLGIEKPFWETDPMGTEAGGWGLYLKTEDLAKFSLCYLNQGMFNGKQVVPKQWAIDSVKYQVDTNPDSEFEDNLCGYGYLWWLTDTKPMCYRADGLFGQYGFVFPELDAIFVSTGAVADEQIARNCVWRHFPKAFLEENTGDKIKIKNTKIDKIPVSHRVEKEKEIDGKKIKIFKRVELAVTGFEPSVLPIAVTQMMTEHGKTPDNIVFKFYDNYLTMSFNEGVYHNTIKCGMAGQYEHSNIYLSGLHFSMSSFAYWKSNNTLVVHARPDETVGKRIMEFTFLKNGVVEFKPSCTPSMREICNYLARAFREVIPYENVRKVGQFLIKQAPPLAEPIHFGIIK